MGFSSGLLFVEQYLILMATSVRKFKVSGNLASGAVGGSCISGLNCDLSADVMVSIVHVPVSLNC